MRAGRFLAASLRDCKARGLLRGCAQARRLGRKICRAAEIHAERAAVEACVFKRAGKGMRGDGQAVDGADEVAAGVRCLVGEEAGEALFGEESAQGRRQFVGARFVGGEEDEQVGIATTQPGNEASGAEDFLGVGSSGELARSGFGVFGFGG